MITWRSGWMWLIVLVVCVGLGAGIGLVSYKYNKPDVPKVASLSCGACQDLLEKPFAFYFTLQGVIEEKKGNNVLVRFNDKEIMWISLHEDYKVFKKSGDSIVEMNLTDVAVGSKVILRDVGISDMTDNFLYADRLEIY